MRGYPISLTLEKQTPPPRTNVHGPRINTIIFSLCCFQPHFKSQAEIRINVRILLVHKAPFFAGNEWRVEKTPGSFTYPNISFITFQFKTIEKAFCKLKTLESEWNPFTIGIVVKFYGSVSKARPPLILLRIEAVQCQRYITRFGNDT